MSSRYRQGRISGLRWPGFASVALYGGIDGSAFDLDAERLVAVAAKD